MSKQTALRGFRQVFECFDAIAETTKRTEKSKILTDLYNSSEAELARHLFWLAMGTPKFYVTSKQIQVKKQKTDGYSSLDAAGNAFLEILNSLMSGALSGNAAKYELSAFFNQLEKKHIDYSEYFRSILDKKLRLGVDTTVTELWTDIVEVFGVPKGKALCKQKTGEEDKAARKMISYPCDVEPKKDGYNISIKCNLKTRKAVALSSDNMELPALQPYADLILKSLLKQVLPKQFNNESVIVLDGECESRYGINKASDTSNWKSSWGKTSALVKAGLTKKGFDPKRITATMQKKIDEDLLFSIYEIYPAWAHAKKFNCSRPARRKLFTAVVDDTKHKSITAIEYVTVKNEAERVKAHQKFLARGEEGSIVRMPDVGVLADSKWRGNFVKVKAYSKEDGIILGVEEGEGRNSGKGGAFIVYLVEKKTISRVTVPTDAAKEWAWKNRSALHGFGVEVVGAKDLTGDANASRNPVLARFRDDQMPMSLKEVQVICTKNKLPVPSKDNIGSKLFSQAIAKIAQ